MYDYHSDKRRYFEMQYLTARDFIIPMLEQIKPLANDQNVLEIGCAEAGVLKAFAERGLVCSGLDLSPGRIETAKLFHKEALDQGRIFFSSMNVYDVTEPEDLGGPFDIIVLKDVIEHIPGQEVFIPVLKRFLKPEGILFFGFPPWQMPFGGHQQMASSKLLSKLPWIHLLPGFLYKQLLKWGGQDQLTLKELMEIKDTGLSIERFEKIIASSGFKILHSTFFFTNPIYKFKFGLTVKKLNPLLNKIPYLRNFYTTAAYYFVGNKNQ